MTTYAAVIPEIEAEKRWSDWQSRGDVRDRQTAARMRKVMLLVVVTFIVWSVVQLT